MFVCLILINRVIASSNADMNFNFKYEQESNLNCIFEHYDGLNNDQTIFNESLSKDNSFISEENISLSIKEDLNSITEDISNEDEISLNESSESIKNSEESLNDFSSLSSASSSDSVQTIIETCSINFVDETKQQPHQDKKSSNSSLDLKDNVELSSQKSSLESLKTNESKNNNFINDQASCSHNTNNQFSNQDTNIETIKSESSNQASCSHNTNNQVANIETVQSKKSNHPFKSRKTQKERYKKIAKNQKPHKISKKIRFKKITQNEIITYRDDDPLIDTSSNIKNTIFLYILIFLLIFGIIMFILFVILFDLIYIGFSVGAMVLGAIVFVLRVHSL